MLCGLWDLYSLTRDQPAPPALEVQSLNQWITREIPKLYTSKECSYLNINYTLIMLIKNKN